jgi:hypothetical protein
MKIKIHVIWMFSLFLVFFNACKKDMPPSAVEGDSSHWLEYSGKSQDVKSVIASVTNSRLDTALKSDCNACYPDWDANLKVFRLTNLNPLMLVPVKNLNGVAEEYIRIQLDENGGVQGLTVRNFDRDFVYSENMYLKSATGLEFLVLSERGTKMPDAFSKEGVEKCAQKAVKQRADEVKARRITGYKNVAINNVEPITCFLYFDPLFMLSYECATSYEIYLYFTNQLKLMLNQMSGNLPFSYWLNPGSTGIELEYNSLVFGNLQGVVLQIWQQTEQHFAPCWAYTHQKDVREICTDPNAPSPENGEPDPCVQKALVNSRNANAVIAAQNSALFGKVGLNVEYGSEQVLTDWHQGLSTFMTKPIRTDNQPDQIESQFSGNATEGYTIGFSHTHPNGTAPSPDDIFEIVRRTFDPELVAAGPDAMDFYKKNVLVTVVTADNNYIAGVKDWGQLMLLHQAYAGQPAAFEQMFLDKVQQYQSYEAAFLDVFGLSINLYTKFPDFPDAVPLKFTANEVTAISCN